MKQNNIPQKVSDVYGGIKIICSDEPDACRARNFSIGSVKMKHVSRRLESVFNPQLITCGSSANGHFKMVPNHEFLPRFMSHSIHRHLVKLGIGPGLYIDWCLRKDAIIRGRALKYIYSFFWPTGQAPSGWLLLTLLPAARIRDYNRMSYLVERQRGVFYQYFT